MLNRRLMLLEEGKNSRQSGTILENSSNKDNQSNQGAENDVRDAEGMRRTSKMSVDEKLKRKKHVSFVENLTVSPSFLSFCLRLDGVRE